MYSYLFNKVKNSFDRTNNSRPLDSLNDVIGQPTGGAVPFSIFLMSTIGTCCPNKTLPISSIHSSRQREIVVFFQANEAANKKQHRGHSDHARFIVSLETLLAIETCRRRKAGATDCMDQGRKGLSSSRS